LGTYFNKVWVGVGWSKRDYKTFGDYFVVGRRHKVGFTMAGIGYSQENLVSAVVIEEFYSCSPVHKGAW
jgi:hypothetical protein